MITKKKKKKNMLLVSYIMFFLKYRKGRCVFRDIEQDMTNCQL